MMDIDLQRGQHYGILHNCYCIKSETYLVILEIENTLIEERLTTGRWTSWRFIKSLTLWLYYN